MQTGVIPAVSHLVIDSVRNLILLNASATFVSRIISLSLSNKLIDLCLVMI